MTRAHKTQNTQDNQDTGTKSQAVKNPATKPPVLGQSQAVKNPAAKPPGLGRGLSALLGEAISLAERREAEDKAHSAAQNISQRTILSIGLLKANANQPRRHFDAQALEELEASIRARGVLQPILVRPHPELAGLYEIVAGERRWRAAERAGLLQVPVVIKELSDTQVLELALVENIQRQDLNPIEEANGYKRLMDEFGHSQEVLAKLVGKSRSHVSNLMRLLELPAGVQDYVLQGQLSMGHARALVGLADAESLAAYCVEKNLSVRAIENLLRNRKTPQPSLRNPDKAIKIADQNALSDMALRAQDPDLAFLAEELSVRVGMTVRVVMQRNKSGVVQVDFSSLEELDALCKRLAPGFGDF